VALELSPLKTDVLVFRDTNCSLIIIEWRERDKLSGKEG
jgi:hypothetical protein